MSAKRITSSLSLSSLLVPTKQNQSTRIYHSNHDRPIQSICKFMYNNLTAANYHTNKYVPHILSSPLIPIKQFHTRSYPMLHLESHTQTKTTSSPSPTATPSSSSKTKSSKVYAPPPVKDKIQRKISLRFSLSDSTGSLQDALTYFQKQNISLSRIESRPNKRTTDYDFYVDFVGDANQENVKALLRELRMNTKDVHILEGRKVPWFPRRIKDLDLIANEILDAGADLNSDHPGFSDPIYRERRKEIAEIAFQYKMSQSIPRITYRPEEIETWGVVWDKLMPLLNQHACAEHVRLLPLLIENCGYRRDNIPQAQDISDFLHECTGFRLRPVAGLLSARNFLYGLAFRVFFSTQYLRHSSKPLYTPEPDLVHELLGHAPLFADQAFADFSQEIGLAAIGATDEQIERLSHCYWFSVEFGLCLQNDERKAYGAGLLSSFGELEYAMSDKPEIKEWNPFVAGVTDYPITTYQPLYFLSRSFDDAKLKMQAFSNSFARPFNVRYNPYTQVVEVDGNISVEGE